MYIHSYVDLHTGVHILLGTPDEDLRCSWDIPIAYVRMYILLCFVCRNVRKMLTDLDENLNLKVLVLKRL